MAEIDRGACTQASIETREERGGTVVVVVSGEIDISNAHELARAVDAVARRSPERIVFELGGLRFMDSAGLAVLLTLAARGPSVRLRNPSQSIRRVVELTGLEEVLRVEP